MVLNFLYISYNKVGGVNMATVSFEQNVVIRDKQKVEEIKRALNQNTSSFTDVKASEKDKLPENASKVWFNR